MCGVGGAERLAIVQCDRPDKVFGFLKRHIAAAAAAAVDRGDDSSGGGVNTVVATFMVVDPHRRLVLEETIKKHYDRLTDYIKSGHIELADSYTFRMSEKKIDDLLPTIYDLE